MYKHQTPIVNVTLAEIVNVAWPLVGVVALSVLLKKMVDELSGISSIYQKLY